MASQKIVVPNIGDFKDVEIIEVLVSPGQKIKKTTQLLLLKVINQVLKCHLHMKAKLRKSM